ncbi:caspase family protein [Mesorhizobium sp. Ld1326N3]|uniref:Caspase family protein n=2 Tax=Mesorhizobium salmacidum TaxID=3015171 RepID=A0ABU8L5T7_9HYPH
MIGLFISPSIAGTPAGKDGPRYHAFLFANSDYQPHDQIPSAKADFNRMEQLFKKLGYDIWPPIDGDGQIRSVKRFYEYMSEARDKLGPDDVVVIYYSGHGFFYGYQNWLVPLDYSRKEHNAQYLREDAIGLMDVIKGLAARRVDFVAVFLDACRTTVSFPLRVGTADKVASPDLTADMIVPPRFQYGGPSLLGEAFGVPAQVGSQAFGGSADKVPSLFTGILAQVLEGHTVLGDADAQLPNAVQELVDEGKIAQDTLNPWIWARPATFDLDPHGQSHAESRTERLWQQTLDRLSRGQVRSFLILNPGTGRSKEAWAYLDTHPNDPVDDGGHSAVDAIALDRSYEQAVGSGMLVAVAVPPPNINFPRETVVTEADSRRDFGKVVVFGNNPAEIAAGFQERYAQAGSRNKFTIDVLQDAKRVVATRQLKLRNGPSFSSDIAARIRPSTAFEIGDIKVDPKEDTLFMSVEPSTKSNDFMRGFGLEEHIINNISGGVPAAGGPLQNWADTNVAPAAGPGFNIIGHALKEVVFDQAAMDDPGGSVSIGSKTHEIVADAKSINWATIAVNFSPVDISELEKELSQIEDEALRVKLRYKIAVTIQENAEELAAADLTARDARSQLIGAGIDGTRISIVKDRLPDIGRGARIRYFGYPR